MHRTVVDNSTPIIALRGIDRLDVLRTLYGNIVIPEAVRDELVVKDAQALAGTNWIKVKPITNIAAKETFITSLHDGEVEVMILAKELNADLVVIDDGLARRHAMYQGLTITGTIGVLIRAKKEGVIDSLRSVLDELIEFGFYVSEAVINEALRVAEDI